MSDPIRITTAHLSGAFLEQIKCAPFVDINGEAFKVLAAGEDWLEVEPTVHRWKPVSS